MPEKMSAKPIEAKIANLVADPLLAIGYELVRVQLTGGGNFSTLQIMAERQDGKAMTVEDCTKISHAVSTYLEDDGVSSHSTLEVSSPGIDRPLVRLKDFERFTGHLVRIELEAMIDGRKRFQGKILRVTGQPSEAAVEFLTDTGDVRVPVEVIARAKLVLTDDLLKQAAAQQREQE